MRLRIQKNPMAVVALIVAGLLAMSVGIAVPAVGAPEPNHEKNVLNYEGGLFLVTNGSVLNGPCFRIEGRVAAPGFFDNLKRIDNDLGATFRRGSENVTQFPEKVFLQFVVYDHYDTTCPHEQNTSGIPYLTRAMMASMHLYLYWKHGVELKPIENVVPKYFSVDPRPLTATMRAAAAKGEPVPERLSWSYEFSVPSADVPLSDSLVLVLRTADNRIAARVAARM